MRERVGCPTCEPRFHGKILRDGKCVLTLSPLLSESQVACKGGHSLALTGPTRLWGLHRTQPASTAPKARRRLRLRRRAYSKRSPRLVPSSGEGRGGGPTAQPNGPVARSARFTQPAARRMAARPARRLSQRDQRTAPAAGPAGGLPHLEADTRTLRVADTSGCRLTFTV